VTVLLDHAILSPGDAVAVPAGVVHSYVGGLAVEVMTSSDNVLRLGLTGKTIAIEEALAAVRLDRSPQLISGRDAEPIAPEGMPFDVVITDSAHALATGRHRTVVALEGEALISTGASPAVRLPEGRAAIWSPDEPDALVRPGGRVVAVTGA
jgi:mannose-6-phosphate isomerase